MKNVRKIMKLLLIFCMACGVVSMRTEDAEAKTTYTKYSFGCSAYEVDTISDSGTFVKVGCYNDFTSARNAMKQKSDAVVRHKGSYTANQIIAMTRGYVYAYARRDKLSTLNIYQNVDSSYKKSTYISNYREMYYLDTLSYDGSGGGKVLLNASGFEGYASLKNVDFIPAKFVDKGLGIWVGGNDATSDKESPWKVIPKRSYFSVEKNGNYIDLVYHEYSDWPVSNTSGNAGTQICSMSVGPAPTFMKQGSIYYSNNDYDFYSDPDMKNKVGTYYNYYQFESWRTPSKIPASAYDGFLKAQGISSSSVLWGSGQTFVNGQNKYGINAALTFAQACVEAAYGTSTYARKRYNLFGWNAVDSNPDKATYFSSVSQCINEHMAYHLRAYTNTRNATFFGGHSGNKESGITVKYASCPYYGLTLSSVMYKFDKFASGNNGTLTDFNSSKIGIVNTYAAPILNGPAGKTLFTTEYGSTYQKNFPVTILGESGNYYKVQSTNYLINGEPLTSAMKEANTMITYDWSKNVGYILKDYVTVVNSTGNTQIVQQSSAPSTAPTSETTATPTSSIGLVSVVVDNLNIRTAASSGADKAGTVKNGATYTVYEVKNAEGYTWYRIGNNQWIASDGSWMVYQPAVSTTVSLSFASTVVKKDKDDKAFTNKVTTNTNGALSYTSSNKNVATVASDGKVTIKGVGSTTITVRSQATSQYPAASASYALVVGTLSAPKLTKLANGQTGTVLEWSKVKNAERYTVMRKTSSSGSWKTLASGLTTTKYTDTTAKSGNKYYYTVVCKSAIGDTTTSKYDKKGKNIRYLAMPVVSASKESSSISISWTASKGTKGYRIYRAVGNGSFKQVAVVSASKKSWKDKNVTKGKKYSYRVRAYKSSSILSSYKKVIVQF